VSENIRRFNGKIEGARRIFEFLTETFFVENSNGFPSEFVVARREFRRGADFMRRTEICLLILGEGVLVEHMQREERESEV